MLDYLLNQNLDFWKHKSWKKQDMLNYYKSHKSIKRLVLITIESDKIIYSNKCRKRVFYPMYDFFETILKNKKFKNLDVCFLISLDDEVFDINIETHDFNKHKFSNYNHKFSWGVSETSKDILKIENSKYFDLNFPLFSPNNNMKGLIIFPHPNLLNKSKNNFKDCVDLNNFVNKIGNKPFYRFSTIRANIFLPSRMKLVEMSFKNPKYLDCKGSNNGLHLGHGDYILQKVFIKLYSKLRIIKLNENKFDSFMEHFNVKNFVPKDKLKNYKYLVTNDSWYNNIDYCMWNSILFRYKLEKSKYYEDFIFEDGTDVVIFDETNFKEKIDGIRNISPEILVKNIENRKKKVKEYLFYDKLVDHYGQLLMKFSEIQKNNQL